MSDRPSACRRLRRGCCLAADQLSVGHARGSGDGADGEAIQNYYSQCLLAQTFLGAHLERVRDLVGRWLPDLNPATVVITLDISPPIAAGFAFHVLFLSDDVNMDARYVQA